MVTSLHLLDGLRPKYQALVLIVYGEFSLKVRLDVLGLKFVKSGQV